MNEGHPRNLDCLNMKIHALNAQGTLTPYIEFIEHTLRDTHRQVSEQLTLPSIDVIVKTGSYVIPEKGIMGYCPEEHLIYLTIDTDSSAFKKNGNESLKRMFTHELHHAARWGAIGYGDTLGAAILSEGLAGHFVLEIFNGEPEQWEMVDWNTLHTHFNHMLANWDVKNYNHNDWFYGTGELPRWLGYSLGFRLVSWYLRSETTSKPSSLVDMHPDNFIAYLKNKGWLDFTEAPSDAPHAQALECK
ncbi:DUF2268 domain-containing putative Zn-dependent protease [Rosenbergiella nectarea]|uniref:DUF2268 domain-containing putative Zn-dependent protease n=2 Tax=Rosenbergiella nectarea TaxID=988801 RepID=UPI001F4D6C5E|nr:DUF2268 domain-containing putative Zn-dependent protease [Rosenbergiella nectarea]